ncbi:MAG TPA: hypothetical protein VGM56_23610 [Byssovorax sp.]|jgi:hypothetical protein
MRPFAFVPVALVVVASLGCVPMDHDADDPSKAQTPNNGAPNGFGAPGAMPGAAPAPYGAPATGQYNPGAAPAPGAAPGAPPGAAPAGGAATPIAPGMAAAASLPLQAMANQEAPGMSPDGGAFAGQFQEGQVLEQPINLQPNKCYTIVSAGIGVQEISIQLLGPQLLPGAPPMILAQSTGSGPQAVLGGGKNCWRFMSPIGAPGKVLVKANKGAGMVAAEVFIKS